MKHSMCSVEVHTDDIEEIDKEKLPRLKSYCIVSEKMVHD